VRGVRGILRFDRTVADLARTEVFYREALGFTRIKEPEPLPDRETEVLGLTGRRARRLRMALNRQMVTFLACDPPGAPAPPALSATDPFFQHLAVSVRDMGAAFAQVETAGAAPISRGGPQHLPPSSGGVSAFKFRDPDGHPLELIHFPDGPAADRWADSPGLCLGIDHSAITVTDLPAAMALLTGPFGLALSERGVNRGETQARLDGVDDPVVDVIALVPPRPAPHVELLHYRQPAPSGPAPLVGPADRASTRFVFGAEDPAAVAGAARSNAVAVTVSADGRAAFVVGPDGHGFLVLQDARGPVSPSGP
jgi:catechol 2,3-dioxygenase-like lactoylglutathione lyase family enzyme